MNKHIVLLLTLFSCYGLQARTDRSWHPAFTVFTDNMPSEVIKIIGLQKFQYLEDPTPINMTYKVMSKKDNLVTVTGPSAMVDCSSCNTYTSCWCQVNFGKPGNYSFTQAGQTKTVTVQDSFAFNPVKNKIYRFDCTPDTTLKIKNANNSFEGVRLDCRNCDGSNNSCYCLVQFTQPGWYIVKQPLDDGSNGFLRRTIEVK